ncbi:uncharacterized protein NECHADRAFT_88834 [Fusarium vanettenii 77-13-4]|uniref:Uncharacterized protein n=1 Tax=Fusarium vanettenii (strain ATCC MYA-4622 / CBS 123669 / FGSC 9596 / NRRL 45880 / 77-13-4) TaxID=660122 RepID=C7ZN56_FUSV7|nr:uncharacterized protein NECHADRAFT_88834 [Fusarium vanettenii 77-13-4]EEU34539.1 predicted protein [Fusarium vanettenii 77-13-4]
MTSLSTPTITVSSDSESDSGRPPSFLLVPSTQRLTVSWKYIRGKHLDDLTTCSTIRIDWTDRDRQIMTSHLARHELHKGDLKSTYMGELMDRLGLSQYARLDTSLMYQSICVNKLQSALEYRLKLLHKAGHVSATFVLPYRAKWKRYTQAWGSDDWNGDMTPPRSHTATPTSISTFSTVATPTPSLGPPPDFPTLSLTTDAILHTPEDQDVVMEDVQDIPQSGLTQQQCAEHAQAFRQQLQRETQQQRAQIQQEQQRQQAAMDLQRAKIKQDAWDVYQARRRHEAHVEAHEQTQSQPAPQPAPQPPERVTGQQALDVSFHAMQQAELQREFERQRAQIQREKDIAQAEIAQQRFELQQQKQSYDADIERGRSQHDMLERETQMAQAAIEQARSRLQQERQMNQAELERERSQLEQQAREFMQVQKEQFQEYLEAQKQQQQSTRHQHPSQQEPWQNQQPTQQQPSQQESLQQKPPPALPLQEQPAHQQLAVPHVEMSILCYVEEEERLALTSVSYRQEDIHIPATNGSE